MTGRSPAACACCQTRCASGRRARTPTPKTGWSSPTAPDPTRPPAPVWRVSFARWASTLAPSPAAMPPGAAPTRSSPNLPLLRPWHRQAERGQDVQCPTGNSYEPSYQRGKGQLERARTVAEDVIVIGGGIVGASAAYALARRGARVTLVDRGDAGQATAAGAGILSPGTSIRPLPAFFTIGLPASAYYDTLLARLAEDGETETGYAVAGLLHIATSEEELTQLPDL